MLESNVVVFAPRLPGTEQQSLCPRRDQARSADIEVLVPISSTKTRRFGSICAASVTLQAALSHSSRSNAPTLRFWAEAHPPEQPTDGRVTQSLARHAPKSG